MTRKMEKSGSGSVLRKMEAINKARVFKTDAAFVSVQMYLYKCICLCVFVQKRRERIKEARVRQSRQDGRCILICICVFMSVFEGG